jgi:hypothetical protein
LTPTGKSELGGTISSLESSLDASTFYARGVGQIETSVSGIAIELAHCSS